MENYGRFLTDGSYDRNTGTLTLSIHTWLVRFSGYNILVDTGVGNSKTVPDLPQFDHLDSPYLERLIAAGVQAEEVEFVLMTHLHLDHVGWNTRYEGGQRLSTFPNAKYISLAPNNGTTQVCQVIS